MFSKKIIAVGISVLAIIIVTASISSPSNTKPESSPKEVIADIIMPTKSSRPGCEENDRCYIPSSVTISAGESVIWINKDSAFHSVTSGIWNNPDGLFNSGHLDPDESFSVQFDKSGSFDFFCTLHPWMKGVVKVV